LDRPTHPQSIATLEENHGCPVSANSPRRLERNPTQGLSPTPSGTAPVAITGMSKLFANRLHRIRVQTQFARRSVGESYQSKCTRTGLVVPTCGFLCFAAEIPHKINRPGLPSEFSYGTAWFLESVSIRQYHNSIVTYSASSPRTQLRDSQRGVYR
jgi:hypothetical protein